MSKKYTRVSVALDKKTEEMLNILVRKKNTTVSEIIRRAINTYFELENATTRITPDVTKIYTDFLSDGEHCIVDIEHWTAMWEELNRNSSEEFWEIMERIGYEHGIQYLNKGMTDVYDILRYMEVGNWFRLKIDGEGCYTLVLSTHTSQKFLKVFLENLFKAQNNPVEIYEGYGKLRIVKVRKKD
ncbi:hypothetical protein Asulf_00425 [Archaeoglobus sulfaticallidus PM70-1]|uniref:Ribbon-helix-helix protein CopG domain-containing protein n=1 Tax=Archaeoglobus sulfaticallidus PM70-1 TaxID=387631 RepID=N0BE03_9EURY|nr:ribbon-helix-helix protein, CopG family [Archaeoglobus sulfaticallidus]AGK60452.1 hypothetical protein Asulf_00425 [Archaeoglobus sulfaticallidus PM70-1]